jgi:hypothetical protein
VRLTDLNPRWAADYDILIGGAVVHDADRKGMAISFDCPCCLGATRLCVFFANPIDGKPPSDDYDSTHLWTRTGETFENLQLSPSIDASEHGHWHGWITDGRIIGGKQLTPSAEPEGV